MRRPVTVGSKRLEERELAGRIPVHKEDPPASLSIQVAHELQELLLVGVGRVGVHHLDFGAQAI